MTAYEVTRLRPTFAARVCGLDLRSVSDDDVQSLLGELHEHRVLVFPDQQLDHADQVRLSRRFGPLDVYPVSAYVVPEHPEVLVISNIVENGRPIGLYDGEDQVEWHTDYSWKEVQSRASLLYSVEAPDEGGDTLFADSTTAYEELPAPLRERVDGLSAVHSMNHLVEEERKTNPLKAPLTPEERQRMPDIAHPLVRTHPVTGRRSLLLGSMIISSVVGLDEPEGTALLDELHARATADRYLYRHRWRVGDLVVWDNQATMHTRTPCDRHRRRLLYRTTVM